MKSKNLHVGKSAPTSGWAAAWAPPVLVATLIFLGSSLGGGALPASPFTGSDKLVHLVEYAALGFTICRAFTRRMPARTGSRRRGPVALLGAIAVASLYGALDELHQTLVPGRVLDAGDLLADAIGASLGATLWWRRAQKHQGRDPRGRGVGDGVQPDGDESGSHCH